MKICRVVTVPFFFQNHLREQVIATIRAGHEVTLVCSPGPEIADLRNIAGVRICEIEIPRKISLWRDIVALFLLTRLFGREKFDVVHSATPKAGMLAAIAGWLVRVPVRLHTFTGQPWVELGGAVRVLAKTGDWLTARLVTHGYTDSLSQRDFLIDQGISKASRLSTLGAGSLAGVDLQRFCVASIGESVKVDRATLGASSSTRIITFIGRATVDKGVRELVAAIRQLVTEGFDVLLLLIGPFEPEHDPLPNETLEAIKTDPHIRSIGYCAAPERYLAMTDIFCIPSYREGFPIVVIEAAAMGVPSVGTDITGLCDAVVDGVTGLLVPVKEVDGLCSGLRRLLNDEPLRQSMGAAARRRVEAQFDSKVVNATVLDEYVRLVNVRRVSVAP
ncbi:glycosyltransferase family 4 protein [Variovorax sp. VNK109]|uniref:glycosyltransferase family 4 protein n=1 Tax=Variovorax sp. VNK109 TaxID=3400919 RepID=UPI003BFFC050